MRQVQLEQILDSILPVEAEKQKFYYGDMNSHISKINRFANNIVNLVDDDDAAFKASNHIDKIDETLNELEQLNDNVEIDLKNSAGRIANYQNREMNLMVIIEYLALEIIKSGRYVYFAETAIANTIKTKCVFSVFEDHPEFYENTQIFEIDTQLSMLIFNDKDTFVQFKLAL